MSKVGVIALVFIIGITAFVFIRQYASSGDGFMNNSSFLQDNLPQRNSDNQKDFERVNVFAEGLEVPWAIAFLPDGNMLVTERAGRVRLVKSDRSVQKDPVVTLSNVKQTSEGGLHGITLHPEFSKNKYVYLYYTYAGEGGSTLNRVSRFSYEEDTLKNETVMVDAIPGASNHDGGRIKFGPDGYLYITTGDAQEPSQAQDTGSLAGKILRVTDSGDPAPGNPFGNRVYSYGHRNPQGIAWDESGRLWSTEHGPSGVETGNDELNRIELGKNYGWPDIRGNESKTGMVSPLLESGRGTTWAPAGLAFTRGKLYFAGLRGEALYSVDPDSPTLHTFLKGEYGRLREVIAGPDGILYVTTSNRDGRGRAKRGDDKILLINSSRL